MITCANCKNEIEKDSFYCDQCGTELLVCSQCGKPGKGKNCIEDGKKLVSAKLKDTEAVIPQKELAIDKPQPLNPDANIQPPHLCLVNNNLETATITIQDGDIIGRKTGNLSHIFSKFEEISGKHLQFSFNRKKSCWTVIDLGSTNRTAYNKSNSDWKAVDKMPPNEPVDLSNNYFLLIANIEFQIKIEQPANLTPTGTKRI